MIDSDPGPGKAVESIQTAPALASKPKLKSKASQESGPLASIFPSIFKKTPKHTRELSCPEDNAELENILVNLHDVDATLYSLYLTPPVTPNQEKSSFSIASRNPHRPSSTKSPTSTTTRSRVVTTFPSEYEQ